MAARGAGAAAGDAGDQKIEARLVPPPRKCLSAIVHGDDEAEAKEKALAEHVDRHPEDVGRMVEDFNWILHEIVRWPVR
jgi:hypothetical protein